MFDDLREQQKIYQVKSDKYTLNPFLKGEIRVKKKGKRLAVELLFSW